MYLPSHFALEAASGLKAIRDFPFALILTPGSADELPPFSQAPMMLDPDADPVRPALLGHVARANGHARALEAEGPASAIFTGPNGYISPNWYPSKRAGKGVVPTWNYTAVQVTGRIRPIPDIAGRRRVVDLLARAFEGDGPGAWRLDDEPEDYVRKMLGGITAFALDIETVEAKAKLSQNRTADDRAGAIAGLRAVGSQALADAMAALD